LNGLIQFTLFLMGKFNSKVEQIESRTASWNGLCSTFEGPLYTRNNTCLQRKHTKFWWHNLNKTGLLEDTGTDDWTILIWVLEKLYGMVYARFIWLRIKTSGRIMIMIMNLHIQ